MGLSTEDIRKRLSEGGRSDAISRAVFQQNRIKFHAQKEVQPSVSPAVTDFLNYVSTLIPSDKFRLFKAMFRYPLKTNEVTGICFAKLSRIFDGRNPSFNYQFANTDIRDDWEQYRQDVLHEPTIWETKGWEFFKNEINSVLIVDLPEAQNTGDRYPRPYFYWLPIESVLDYQANPTTGQMYYIAFKQDEDKIAVIDEERYRVYTSKDGNIDELLIDNPHDIGYCPARFFWDEPISLKDPDIKESPLTEQLESLDWYLFYHLAKRHLDLIGGYPIFSGYVQSCDFEDEDGNHCCDGFLRDSHDHYLLNIDGSLKRCPKCGSQKMVGPGTMIEIPAPVDGEPDMRNPVQMLSIDRNSLEYNVAEEQRLRDEIISSVVGTDEGIQTKEAMNEIQINAAFESQSTILNRVKKGFESAQQFVDETICRLRYGNQFISAKVNYGTEFFIFDATQLRERYKVAKESGASEAELDALQQQIIETEYRNNPMQLQRMLILSELEPYRHLSRAELLDLHQKGIIDDADLKIKLNFASLIKRFEREEMNIIEFANGLPFSDKIEIINQKLKEYVSTDIGRTD